MIQLTRNRTPKAIPTVFHGARKAARETRLLTDRRAWLRTGPVGGFSWEPKLWKPAKTQLAVEAGDKCAYCEANAKTVCHCDVEHVRPKAVYWWLALCYENYVLACQLCNQAYKGEQYPCQGARLAGPALGADTTDAALAALAGTFTPDPLSDTATMKLAGFQADFAGEMPGLIDPYLDSPEQYFIWEPERDQSRIWIRPRAGSGTPKWRAETSIETLGLNREELLRLRWKTYRPIAMLCRLYDRDRLTAREAQETEATLREAMASSQPFAGLCRWAIREEAGLAL